MYITYNNNNFGADPPGVCAGAGDAGRGGLWMTNRLQVFDTYFIIIIIIIIGGIMDDQSTANLRLLLRFFVDGRRGKSSTSYYHINIISIIIILSYNIILQSYNIIHYIFGRQTSAPAGVPQRQVRVARHDRCGVRVLCKAATAAA